MACRAEHVEKKSGQPGMIQPKGSLDKWDRSGAKSVPDHEIHRLRPRPAIMLGCAAGLKISPSLLVEKVAQNVHPRRDESLAIIQ